MQYFKTTCKVDSGQKYMGQKQMCIGVLIVKPPLMCAIHVAMTAIVNAFLEHCCHNALTPVAWKVWGCFLQWNDLMDWMYSVSHSSTHALLDAPQVALKCQHLDQQITV